MNFIFNLFSSYPYIDLSYDYLGWLGFFLLLILFAFVLYSLREEKREIPNWKYITFFFLALLQLLVSLFLGFRFPGQQVITFLDIRTIYHPAAVMVFSAVPMVLAAGFLGPIFASILGALNGLMLGFWDTHSLFTVIEIAGLSFIYAWAIRQNYRTRFFRVLRHPFLSGVLIPILYLPVLVASSFFASTGELAIRIDYAITQTWPFAVGLFITFVFAGIIAELISILRVKSWGQGRKLSLAPTEKSLFLRYILIMVPLFVFSFLFLLFGDWYVAGNASRRLLEDRLSNISLIAADSLPYFLETGQNLITNYSETNLLENGVEDSLETLSDLHSLIPFFSSLSVLDSHGDVKISYPSEPAGLREFVYEPAQMVINGVNALTYAFPSMHESDSAQIAFISRVMGEEPTTVGAIVGVTELGTNPLTQPAIQAIKTIEELGGEGWILDENHQVVYHSDASKVLDKYFGAIPQENSLIEQTNPGEIPQFLYYRTIKGRPWVIVLSVPSAQVQQLSFEIVVPLLIILLIISAAIYFLWRYLFIQITGSLNSLADDATVIANGNFNHSLNVNDHDEIGRFASAFEQMRLSLHMRAEKLDRLLDVTQVATANLDLQAAVLPILKVCLRDGAVFARAVLSKPTVIGSLNEGQEVVSIGRRADSFGHIDHLLSELLQDRGYLTVSDCSTDPLLKNTAPIPGALIGFALKHEIQHFGILWIAYSKPKKFQEDEIHFLNTLSNQASLAAANSSLYTSSEIGRQRLEAVLSSTPDPILVFDQNDKLFLLNTAANQIPALIKSSSPGEPVQDVIAHKSLLEFIQQPISEGSATQEIVMPNGKIYSASVAKVDASGQHVGKICLLRDVTQYKEIDSLKSEFVSTVSHDLKSPLTLLRGYTTMLEMVGEFNDQQRSYAQKIIGNVDQMTHLVDNILDLGRIESGLGLNIQKINVVNVIEKVITLLEPHAMQKSIQLIINENVESTVMVGADPALLQQALMNLVENAIKFTGIGGQIEITTQYGTESVIFEIKDNGIGISPLDLPHMFEKFYRSGHREVYRQGGTGLGLAIVKSIAERHGGRVWVQSQLGSGSTFYFEIPYRQVY